MKLAVNSSPHFAAYPLKEVELNDPSAVLKVTSHHFEEVPFAVETKVLPMINPYKKTEYTIQQKPEQKNGSENDVDWFMNYE